MRCSPPHGVQHPGLPTANAWQLPSQWPPNIFVASVRGLAGHAAPVGGSLQATLPVMPCCLLTRSPDKDQCILLISVLISPCSRAIPLAVPLVSPCTSSALDAQPWPDSFRPHRCATCRHQHGCLHQHRKLGALQPVARLCAGYARVVVSMPVGMAIAAVGIAVGIPICPQPIAPASCTACRVVEAPAAPPWLRLLDAGMERVQTVDLNEGSNISSARLAGMM